MIPNYTRFKTRHCGDAITIQYDSSVRVHIIFVDSGHTTTTTARTIRSQTPPNIKDPTRPAVCGVGYLGVGHHKSYTRGVSTNAGTIWRGMMHRCYGAEYRPAYEGVTVCAEWHNFQAFAEWYEVNGGGKGLQLDKDIKVVGNKVYGPDRCMIVTPSENIRASRPGCDIEELRGDIRARQASAAPCLT